MQAVLACSTAQLTVSGGDPGGAATIIDPATAATAQGRTDLATGEGQPDGAPPRAVVTHGDRAGFAGASSTIDDPLPQRSMTMRPPQERDTQTSMSCSPSAVRPRRSSSPCSTVTGLVPQKPCWHEYWVVGSLSSSTAGAERSAGTSSTRPERASFIAHGTPSMTGGGLNRS